MRTASVSEAKNSLRALLREIRGGATVVITDRGVPVARLMPVTSARGLFDIRQGTAAEREGFPVLSAS